MSKKRANGEGSVYKTKDGRVIGSWEDANGKTRYMTSKTMTKREMSKAVRCPCSNKKVRITVPTVRTGPRKPAP